VERAEEWPNELFDLEVNPSEDTNIIGSPPNRERMNALRTRLRGFFQASGAPPIGRWHDSVRNVLTIDTGYYDKWLEFRTKE
jgi:hypothetical protein